jgi:hypothetical protein
VNAGNIIWVVGDNTNNPTVFVVKTSDIVVDGTFIGDAAVVGIQTSVSATIATIIDMTNSTKRAPRQ